MGDRSLATETETDETRESRPSQGPSSHRSGSRRVRRTVRRKLTSRARRRRQLQRELVFWVFGLLAVAITTYLFLRLNERGP